MDMFHGNKSFLSWLTFDRNRAEDNRVCHAFPRYIRLSDGSMERIPLENNNPANRINILIPKDLNISAEDLYAEKGSLVLLKFNVAPSISSTVHPTIRYNPSFGRNSEVLIEKFSGRGLIQILQAPSDFTNVKELRCIDMPELGVFSNELLIRSQNNFYGPFDCDPRDGKIFLTSKKEYQYFVGEYPLQNISSAFIDIIDNFGDEQILFVPKDSLPAPDTLKTSIDLIGEDKLVDSLIATLKTADTYTKNQIRQIKSSILEAMIQQSEVELTAEREERTKKILNSIIERDDFLKNIVYYIFETPELSDSLTKLVCSKYFEKIEEKSRDFIEVKERLSALQAEENSVKNRLEILRADENILTNEAIERNQRDNKQLEEAVVHLKNEIDRLIIDKDNLQKSIGMAMDIAELIEKKNRLEESNRNAQAENDRYSAEKTRLEDQLKETLKGFDTEAKKIARAIDSKLLNQVLRAAGGEDSDESKIVPFNSQLLFHSDESSKLSGQDIIAKIGDYIREKANRSVTDNDVTNYLICIMQGFITTFAGEPGTGKTSLCNIIAKSLGLARTGANCRFVDISVERGWSSHKDFIGYYNPLTKMMEKSNNRAFDALAQLDYEFSNQTDAPFFILLDEANLSPIEHYWAAFLKLCDYDSSYSRTISLGGKQHWNIPNNLRFLATVNFDHTTEELSQRFLDRSWIITLKPTKIDSEAMIKNDINNQETIIPFSALEAAFMPKDEIIIDDEVINTQWLKIQSIFNDSNLPIMPRNQKMVQVYCSIACKYMDTQSPKNRFDPLDYALAQKILTTINGTGNQYKQLLEKLQAECSSMTLSSGHIARMLSAAENNYGFYQFFSK